MPKTTSFVVVGEKNPIRVQRIIATKTYNVVDYRWVLECIERKAYEFPAMQHVSERLEREWFCWGVVVDGHALRALITRPYFDTLQSLRSTLGAEKVFL